jgi:hypothetical protein
MVLLKMSSLSMNSQNPNDLTEFLKMMGYEDLETTLRANGINSPAELD